MDLNGARDYILKRLEKKLSPNLIYHGVHHTMRVVESLEMYINEEHPEEEEIPLLRTAAYFHDAGFLFRYENNEELAITLAEEVLPGFDYTNKQIAFITAIINSTQSHIKPTNLCEEIMNDADHDYFGTDEYYQISALLRQELSLYGYKFSDFEWLNKQYNYLLHTHKFYTQTGIKKRKQKKYEIIAELKFLLDKKQ